MKKGIGGQSKLIFLSFLILIGLIFAVSFVFASHVVTTSSGETAYSINEDTWFLYNVTVNNSDGAIVNITAVNITYTATFTYLTDSNGTDAAASTFTNTSALLSWTNAGLIENTTWKNFWFNASIATPGVYNLTVMTFNETGSYYSNISVTINDTTPPALVLSSPTNNTNSSDTLLDINFTINDGAGLGLSTCWYSNDSDGLINTTLASCANITTLTWTEGTHNVTIWANDTLNNVNSTTVRFTIDSVVPAVSIISPTNNTNSTTVGLDINYSASDGGVGLSTCWYSNDTMSLNITLASCANITIINWTQGPHNVTIWANDTLNNVNSTTVRFTIDSIVPTVTLISPASAASATTSAYNFTFNVTDTNIISNCSLVLDNYIINDMTGINNSGGTNGLYNSSLSVSDHTWRVSCTDIFGNTANSSTRTFTVSAAATTTSSSSGGSSASSSYSPQATVLSQGYTKQLIESSTVNFKVGSSTHTFKVDDITPTTAKITVSSTPQTATLAVGEEKKFEVNGDAYYDLLVKLNSIKGSYADFTLTTINESMGSLPKTITNDSASTTPTATNAKDDSSASATPKATPDEKKNSSWLWMLVVVIIIVILAVVFYRRNSR